MKRQITSIYLPDIIIEQIPAGNKSEFVEISLLWVLNQLKKDANFRKEMTALQNMRRDSM